MVATVAVAVATPLPLPQQNDVIMHSVQPEMVNDFTHLQSIENNDTQAMNLSGIDLAPLSPNSQATNLAAEKAKLHQQALMLEKWLIHNENNLYPTREQKEKMATEMKMTYIQVNRWFANRRRKQSKRIKLINQQQQNSGRISAERPQNTVVTAAPELEKTLTSQENVQLADDLIQSFAKVIANSPATNTSTPTTINGGLSSIATSDQLNQSPIHSTQINNQNSPQSEQKMMDRQQTATPPAIEDPNHALLQQLLAMVALHQQLDPKIAATTTNPLLALCNPQYAHLIPLLQQLQVQQQMQQQLAAQQLQQTLLRQHQASMAAPQISTNHSIVSQSQTQFSQVGQTTIPQPTPPTLWSPPVTASPPESVSELSELSPRPGSPPFKDPHQLADPQLLRILNNHTELTEKEHIAVTVLAGMCNMR